MSGAANQIIELKKEMDTSDQRQASINLVEGALRTEFGSRDCKTIAYPSIGGIILGYFTGVELAWLGLSRSYETKHSIDPHKEDAFAFQMLRLGARWWLYWKLFLRQGVKMVESPYGHHFPPDIIVGYPSTGGVWILKAADNRIRLPDDAEERPEDWAKFYTDVEECADVPKTLEEGIEIGRYYEGLLKKMEDDAPEDYLDSWHNSL